MVFLACHFREFCGLCVRIRPYDSSIIFELQAEECGSPAMESSGESVISVIGSDAF